MPDSPARFPFTFFQKLVGFGQFNQSTGKIIQMKNLILSLVLAMTCLTATQFSAAAQATPVVKTSFKEVTSQLDPGGDFYMYLGTEQWLAHLSAGADNLRHIFTSMPDVKTNDLANINKGFDVLTRVIKDSGLESLTGLGVSSVQIESDFWRSKVLMHHYPGQGDGFLWKLCGGPPHPLSGLDLLPANTALAVFSDADLPLMWSVIKDETAKSGFPDAQTFLNQLPAQFEKATHVQWDTFLGSLGGEFGLVLTLDEANKVPIPVPPSLINVPSPGLLLAIRVNNDTVFNAIAAQLQANPQVIHVETNGLRMRIMPVPIPMAIDLRPTAASSGSYLFIASSDSLVQEVLDVQAGRKPGLKSSAEFKHLSLNIPDQGNQFYYVGTSFTRTMVEIQQQVMANAGRAGRQDSAQMGWLQSFANHRPAFSYTVGMNMPDGCLSIGNGSQSAAALAALPFVAVPGMLAAIAIPNFVKARATAQENGCINNLRQIDAAKQQWALEKNKTATDVPTAGDIAPYLLKMPTCPAGGTYTIGAVGEKPTCSLPNHVLP
jgi:hypothetical protein